MEDLQFWYVFKMVFAAGLGWGAAQGVIGLIIGTIRGLWEGITE